MGWTFGRPRRDGRTPAGDAPRLADELGRARDDAFTGVLDVTVASAASQARLFLLDGCLYSVQLTDYRPEPILRLRTAGLISPEDAAVLASEPEPERAALERGMVTIDAIATVHQELLLACAGAVLRTDASGIVRRAGATSSVACTVPVTVDDVLAAVDVRARRLAATWSAACTHCDPDHAVLTMVPGVDLPASELAELTALATGIDGRRTLDELAGTLGLTRAEAVHLAASLVTSGAVQCRAEVRERHPAMLSVPEAFGPDGSVVGEPAPAEPDAVLPPPAEPDAVLPPPAEPDAVLPPPAEPDVTRLLAELSEAQDAQRRAEARVADIAARLAQARAGTRPPA